MSIPKSTLRRSQVIAPFGVGAIHILKGTRAVVTAGLDFWFGGQQMGAQPSHAQIEAVSIREPRLEGLLDVSHFRLPPGPETVLPDQPALNVPLFRFPSWYICPRCGVMSKKHLTAGGTFQCQKQECHNSHLTQTRFASACDAGHLSDFPWREWVHKDSHPTCNGQLYYKSGGAGGLEDIQIKCEKCTASRSMGGVMSGSYGRDDGDQEAWSGLARFLVKGENFSCLGGRVWLGEQTGQPCSRPIRAILINSTNVHYAKIASAIWIPATPPAGDAAIWAQLHEKLDAEDVRRNIRIFRSLNYSPERIANEIKERHQREFAQTETDDLLLAMQGGAISSNQELTQGEDPLRLQEYEQLQRGHDFNASNRDLVTRIVATDQLSDQLPKFLDGKLESVTLIDKLRETRVMYGFARLLSEKPEGAAPYQQMLWKNWPRQREDRWLPANVVYGEGIFLKFNEAALNQWETQTCVVEHVNPLQERYDSAAQHAGWEQRVIVPRHVLLHTLSHLIMRRLAFECGYGSSSLRERLYISEDADAPMAGILIYTASADSEGSLGGLVRMGEPANLARVLTNAVEDARWCSADPVCTEIGNNGGQGSDGLNIAACHCCALTSETSCEDFNRTLDRQLLTGSAERPNVGFFKND